MVFLYRGSQMRCARIDEGSFSEDEREATVARYKQLYFGTRTANGSFDCVLRAVSSMCKRGRSVAKPSLMELVASEVWHMAS